MELDDLKLAVAQLERRVIDVEAAVRHGHEANRRWNAVRRPLIALGVYQTISAIFGVCIIATIAPFWMSRPLEPAIIGSAVFVHLYGVAVVAASVLQLIMIGRTYYTDAVVPFQRRFAQLVRVRTVAGWIAGLPWWILWMLIVVLVVNAETGKNLFVEQPGWVIGSLVIGIAGMVGTLVLARRWEKHPPAELDRFERE